MKTAPRGFALVTAIFLLVGLAALGVFMVKISGTQQTAISQSVFATRVYFGAKAGLEYGIHRAIAEADCPGPATPVTPTGNGFSGVSVSVTCSTTATSDTGGNVYRIVSTATRGTYGTLDYARREMEATVTNVP
jgi:MSHA biogenesis protein MshP